MKPDGAAGRFDAEGYAKLLAAAEAAQAQGNYLAGARHAGEAALLAAVPGQEGAQARAYLLQATQLQRTGATEPAARACERACALFETAGELAALSEALTDLTLIYVLLGLQDEALEAVTRSLKLAQQLGDNRLLYWAHNRTGVVRNAQADPEQAEIFMLSALELAGTLGPAEQFCILNNLADNAHDLVPMLRARGDAEAAAASLERGIAQANAALALTDPAKQPYQRALARSNLGFLQALAGDFAAAEESLTAGAEAAAAQGYGNLTRMTQHFTARMRLMQGRFAEGIEGLSAVLAQASASGDKLMAARINLQLSQAYEAAGEPGQALQAYRAYHALEREFNSAVAQTRVRLLSNMFELEASKLAAERARLEAELFRAQSAALEAEKRDLQQKADELGRRAEQDALTGLWNRRYVDGRLPALYEQLRREARIMCVAIWDIDRFKTINDRLGHAAGDKVLAQIARLLAAGARASDIVARIGGEEFLMVFQDADLAAAGSACERLREAVAAFDWARLVPGLEVTISAGLTCNLGAPDFAAAMSQADRLLYAAKQGGRNRLCAAQSVAGK
jgi:diguanylate cyclase (GGDEF)-like protein